MSAVNPLSVGYSAIQAAMANWPALIKIVTVNNLQATNLQTPGYVPRLSAQAADRPEIRVGEGKLAYQPYQRNSKATQIVLTYPIQISGGQLAIDRMNLVNIVFMQAMKNAGIDLGQPGVIYCWVPVAGDMNAKDALTRRQDWVTFMGITITFLIGNFVSTTYTAN